MPEGGEEEDAASSCLRREEVGHLVVEEGEPCCAETLGVGREVQASARDPSLELGRPVAAIAKAFEHTWKIDDAVDVYRRLRRELLAEAEAAGYAAEGARSQALERSRRAAIAVCAGGDAPDGAQAQVQIEERRARRLEEAGRNRPCGAVERGGQLLEGDGAPRIEGTGRAAPLDHAVERLPPDLRVREPERRERPSGRGIDPRGDGAAPCRRLGAIRERGGGVCDTDRRVVHLRPRERLRRGPALGHPARGARRGPPRA